jgi:hypothetical protein
MLSEMFHHTINMKTIESNSKEELLAWFLVSWYLRSLTLAMISWATVLDVTERMGWP